MKPVKLLLDDWNKVKNVLKEEYPLSTVIIRDKMKRELGFLPRFENTHENLIYHYNTIDGTRRAATAKNVVVIDFFDEKRRTWFLLRFSEFVNKLDDT